MFYPTGLLWAAINTRIEQAARQAACEADSQARAAADGTGEYDETPSPDVVGGEQAINCKA